VFWTLLIVSITLYLISETGFVSILEEKVEKGSYFSGPVRVICCGQYRGVGVYEPKTLYKIQNTNQAYCNIPSS
jgi:hypothetical protein